MHRFDRMNLLVTGYWSQRSERPTSHALRGEREAVSPAPFQPQQPSLPTQIQRPETCPSWAVVSGGRWFIAPLSTSSLSPSLLLSILLTKHKPYTVYTCPSYKQVFSLRRFTERSTSSNHEHARRAMKRESRIKRDSRMQYVSFII